MGFWYEMYGVIRSQYQFVDCRQWHGCRSPVNESWRWWFRRRRRLGSMNGGFAAWSSQRYDGGGLKNLAPLRTGKRIAIFCSGMEVGTKFILL